MALAILKPVKLSWHQVSTLVNNSKNKSDDCNKRLEENKNVQKTLTSWFTKTEKRKSNENITAISKKPKKEH